MDRVAMMRKNWNNIAVVFTETANKFLTLQCAQHLHSHMQLDHAHNVLEVAAGAGLGSLDAAQYLVDGHSKLPRTTKRTFTVTDLSPVMVELARKNLSSAVFAGIDIQCREANGQDLTDVASSSVDRYIASLCLQLAPDPDALLRETQRVLTPDGIAGFTIWGSPEQSGTFVINATANKALGLEENTAEHSNFIMGKDLPALRQRFTAAGCNHVQIWPFQCVVELWSGDAFAQFHQDTFPLDENQEELKAKRFDVVKQLATEWLAREPPSVSRRIAFTDLPPISLMSSPSRRLSVVQRHLSAPMTYKSPVTSHVLDTSVGRPAADVRVELQNLQSGVWTRVSDGLTNADGRVASPLVPPSTNFDAGTYRMVFYTQEYFEANGVTEFFYPEVTIAFVVKDPSQHYHVPLLINPFGFSTYRGS